MTPKQIIKQLDITIKFLDALAAGALMTNQKEWNNSKVRYVYMDALYDISKNLQIVREEFEP